MEYSVAPILGLLYLIAAYALFLTTVRSSPGGVPMIEAMNRLRGEAKGMIRVYRKWMLWGGIAILAVVAGSIPSGSLAPSALATIALCLFLVLAIVYWSVLMMVNSGSRIAAALSRDEAGGIALAFRAAAVPGFLGVSAILMSAAALMELNGPEYVSDWPERAGGVTAAVGCVTIALVILAAAFRKFPGNSRLVGPAFAATGLLLLGVAAMGGIMILLSFGLVGWLYLGELVLLFGIGYPACLYALFRARRSGHVYRAVTEAHFIALFLVVAVKLAMGRSGIELFAAPIGIAFSAASLLARRMRASLTTHLFFALLASAASAAVVFPYGVIPAFGESIVAFSAYAALAPVTLAAHILATGADAGDPFSTIGLGKELWYAHSAKPSSTAQIEKI